MQSTKCLILTIALTFVVLTLGCGSGGPEMGTVTGTITLDGSPAANLEVTFDPKQAGAGTTAIGYTDAGGKYKLSYPGGKTGAPLGDYRVSIVPAEMDDEAAPAASIPARYNSQTELSFTVQAGENKADFDLESK